MVLLAVDDDVLQLQVIERFCSAIEYPLIEFYGAADMKGCMERASNLVVDIVITDLHLANESGFDVLKAVKELNPGIAVILMTAYEDAREAVSLLKAGADDYLVKPIRKDDLQRIVLRVNERDALMHEALLPPVAGPSASPATAGIVYQSDVLAGILSVAARAAASSATVLVSGESGTGKELVARFIHERSGRTGSFVPVNISALPETLAESELFGHRKGSFTGADSDRVGRFEEAAGGTLFLDEIGDISPALQVKLLRALQFGVIERIGENVPRKLDVRIVAATNRDLPALIREGRFRQDLFYRLNVIEIRLPPLRERKEDIRLLVDEFVKRYAKRDGKDIKGISRDAFDALIKRPFPGNVRELENLIERAVVLSRSDYIRVEDLPPPPSPEDEEGFCVRTVPEGAYETSLRDFERELVSGALKRSGGNQSAAARSLGISERHLRSRLDLLGLK
ncbi:MAG TPA: sigma-54 dependent transcriptional regulator [Treponemataceae bacterium]|nr:sigma-54 dependent transcriptional regulator [Treponemataceae bacterium]HPS45264.1 sigma-54 dependent transcriptional regulator [Treponemataceae bacterium]